MTFFKPPQNPGKLTIALFGESLDLMAKIESKILQGHSTFVKNSDYFELREDASFRIISAPNFFDEKCWHPDQKIIDFMALSDPGPHRFMLAIDSENTPEGKIMNQWKELKKIFGKNVTKTVVIISENQTSLKGAKDMQNIQTTTVRNDLVSELREWSLKHQPFQFDYKNYSHDTVRRRKDALESTRNELNPQSDLPTRGSSADGSSETVFNIVLLGKSGTGKSASGNTILAAGNSYPTVISTLAPGSSPEFQSRPSSTPVTTKCEVRMMKLGMQVRVVDTPDFFCEEQVEEAQLEECKKYCQEEDCVVLLVIQLGRFTDGERGILEKLEENLGWSIREKTIVLFTHGEDLNVEVEKFIGERSHLKHIVEACGGRYHVFKNTSKDTKQVMALTEKFAEMCPNFTRKKSSSQCCLC